MSTDLTHENRTFFNANADKYDTRPGVQEGTRRIANAMRKAYPFDEERTVMLDYACGTGLVSSHLASSTKRIIGVDISQGMVDIYNERVRNQGIPPEEMNAVVAELKGTDDELDGVKFDVIVCSMSYHHFPSIPHTTKILSTFLKPSGTLLVADFGSYTPSDPNSNAHAHKHMVNHAHRHGITQEEIESAFEEAGLGEFEFSVVTTAWRGEGFGFDKEGGEKENGGEGAKPKGDKTYFFLAKGTKPQ